MKQMIFLVTLLSFIITMYFSKHIISENKETACGRTDCHSSYCPYASKTSEGTEENPLARKQYEWLKYRNPHSNSIPQLIHLKENTFVNNLRRLNKSSYSKTNYNWEWEGPYNLGGRVRAVALDYENENIILAAGVSGGMWKTTNGGQSWIKTTASNQLHNVSCVIQNKYSGRRNILYYGTGEGLSNVNTSAVNNPIFSQIFRGDGIFKSTDYGNSWSILPSTVSGTATISDNFDFVIELETFGEDGVFAATSNGLFMSTNGGSRWSHVLNFGPTYTGCNIEVTDNGVFYASIAGEGNDNGVYRSTNGTSWQKISPTNFPTSAINNVLALAPSNQNILYSFISTDFEHSKLMMYEDGVGWTDLTTGFYGGDATTYGGIMQVIKVKPDDPNTFFVGTVGLHRTTDGGKTFTQIATHRKSYVDQQSFVFSRSNPSVMYVGNDGGIWKTNNCLAVPTEDLSGNLGIEWQSLTNNFRNTQFYTVNIDHTTSNSRAIIGGLQDRGQFANIPNSRGVEWDMLMLGDGGFTAISDGGEFYYYALAGANLVQRAHKVNNEWVRSLITPVGYNTGIWMPQMILDPHDSRLMYIGAANSNYQTTIWRNSNLSQIPDNSIDPININWTSFSSSTTSSYNYSALGMSKALPRRLYAGTTTGKFYKIDNPHEGQPSLVELTSPGNDNAYIHCINVDPLEVNKIIVVLPNYGIQSIYYSTDGGINWASVSGNLEENPDGSGNGPSVRWVSVLYVNNRPIYFAATSAGLFSTTNLNGMNTVWIQESPDLIGNIPCDMVDVRQSDGWVVVGTIGNGVYSTNITEINVRANRDVDIPTEFSLEQNYPNPFNPNTSIRYSIPKNGFVTLSVYDITGKKVTTFINEFKLAGNYTSEIRMDSKKFASGIYFYQLRVDNYSNTKKMILIK